MPTLALQKIRNIAQKIVDLKHTQEKLQQQIELKIISLLKAEKAFATDFAILYGAIYELTQKLKNDSFHNTNPDDSYSAEIANWRQLGISLLQKSQAKNTEKNKAENKGKIKEENTYFQTKSATSVSGEIAVAK